MKKIGLFKKINILYTKSAKVIIGDKPTDDNNSNANNKTPYTTLIQSKLQTIKTFTKNKIEKVKKVGIKQSILTMGEPEKKDVLYKEVAKRENQEAKEKKKISKELEKSKKAATKKALTKKKTDTKKPVTKKSPTKKTKETKTSVKDKKETLKKTTKDTSKKTVAKKVTTAKKSTEKKPVIKKDSSKKSSAKKTATKKTETKTTTTKKKTTTKTTPTKKAAANKKDSAPKGSKRDAKIALYIKDIKKHYGEVDEGFVAIIVKNLGPSIYRRDAELVSCSDPKELDTVRRNFLIKKLGIDASKGVLDAAIQDVCTELKGVRTKYRATFYYALAKKFKKESALS